MRRLRRSEGGYTIVEMVIVMAILMTVLAVTLPFLYTSMNQATRTQNRLDAVEQARSAFRTMTRELRQAAQLLDDSGNSRGSGKTQLSFTVDFNGDGTINACDDTTQAPECVVYTYQGSDLFRYRRKQGGASASLASGVTAFTLTYFGNDQICDLPPMDGILTEAEIDRAPCGDGNGRVNGSEFNRVTRVRVEVTVRQGQQEQTLTSDLTLRNLNKLTNPQ